MTQPIAKRFPTPAIDSLPDDIRTRLVAVAGEIGFVPNVFLTLDLSPGRISGVLCLSRCADGKGRRLTNPSAR